jgi:hypothetical protein
MILFGVLAVLGIVLLLALFGFSLDVGTEGCALWILRRIVSLAVFTLGTWFSAQWIFPEGPDGHALAMSGILLIWFFISHALSLFIKNRALRSQGRPISQP